MPLSLAVLLLALSGCKEHPKAPEQPAARNAVPVRIAKVEARQITATEEVVGTVRAKLQASIEAKVSGRIAALPVVPGQAVKRGELLVELDARELSARLQQATAQRDQYQRETERLRGLLTLNAVSRQEFESIESRYRIAAATVMETETLLDYTKITAPFDGVITRKLADVGDLALPGKLLLQMEDPSLFRLEADIPESLIGQMQIGQELAARLSSLPDPIRGPITEIAPAADPASRTFLVKIDLPACSGIRAGTFGRLLVPAGEHQRLLVPAEALITRGQLEMVFVAEQQLARLRLVKTGKLAEQGIEIVSGLNPSESVVISGADRLRDGDPLEIQP